LRFHVATTQEEGRLVILDKDNIEPGEELYVQFVFKKPVVVLPGDRFILRGPYTVQTIGGGVILDIMPPRHKRKDAGLPDIYKLLREGKETEKAGYHIGKGGFKGIAIQTLAVLCGTGIRGIEKICAALVESGAVKIIGRTSVHMEHFVTYKKRIIDITGEYHKANPLKVGIPKEELRTRLPVTDIQIFQAALDECVGEGHIVVEKDRVKSSSHSGGSEKTGKLESSVLDVLRASGLTPPNLNELAEKIVITEKELKDLLGRLVFKGMVVKVTPKIYFHHDAVEGLKNKVIEFIKRNGEMGPSDLKAELDLSRKYLIPLLEYLDQIKLTIRKGDKRVLRG